MKLFGVFSILTIMSATIVFATDDQSPKQAFFEAYKAYQAGLENGASRTKILSLSEDALEKGEAYFKKGSKNLANLTANVVDHLRKAYKREEATEFASILVKRTESAYGEKSEELVSALIIYAETLGLTGEYANAKKMLTWARSIAKKIWEDKSPDMAWMYLEIGKASMEGGVTRDADNYLLQAENLYQELGDM